MKTSNCVQGNVEMLRSGSVADENGRQTILGRLIGLMKENERLFAEQRLTRERMIEARLYQISPQNNPVFATAVIERLRQRHSGLIAVLRSNRIEARALLAGLERLEIA